MSAFALSRTSAEFPAQPVRLNGSAARRAERDLAQRELDRTDAAIDRVGRAHSLACTVLAFVAPLPPAALGVLLMSEQLVLLYYILGLTITLPIAARMVARVSVATSRKKLALRQDEAQELGHLSRGLAKLAGETVTALAVTERDAGVPLARAIWEWTWAVRQLSGTEINWLEDRGHDLTSILAHLDSTSSRRSSSSEDKLARARLFELLEALSRPEAGPYRRPL